MIWALTPVIPFLKKRWDFEQLNLSDQSGFYRSFKLDGVVADRTYQVSSEGEWEQAWPFVLADLSDRLRVELITTSPSLERRVQLAMAGLDRQSIRFLRLPLLSYFPWAVFGRQNIDYWCSAQELVLCRYDFYPELMLRGAKMKSFVLLSASLKSKASILKAYGTLPFYWLQGQYRLFSKILMASLKEKSRFSHLSLEKPLWSYEARGLQIALRLKNARHTFEQRQLTSFVSALESFPRQQRLIMGSAWSQDLELLRSLSKTQRKKLAIVVAPHSLKTDHINRLQKEMGPEFEHFLFDGQQSQEQIEQALQQSKLVWVTMPGLLLELYTLFETAFVGGGFGRSVHSVLEPHLAGCRVLCGPKIHRSTEVEKIQQEKPDELFIVQSEAEFAQLWRSISELSLVAPKNISYYEDLYEKERQHFNTARLFFLGHYTGEQ